MPNLRSGPGTHYAIEATVVAGQRMTVLGQTQAGDWYYADYYWIHAELVEPQQHDVPIVTPRPTKTPDAEGTRVAGIRSAAPAGVWCQAQGGLQVCVTQFAYEVQHSYSRAGNGRKWVVFVLGVNNGTRSRVHVNPHYATLVDLDGWTYPHDAIGYTYWTNPLRAVDVEPGNSAGGGIAFNIPYDTGPARVIYDGMTIDLTQPPTRR